MIQGSIVLSVAGRDKGRLHLILETGDTFALIADGKWRKVQAPKRKKLKHLKPLPSLGAHGVDVTNRELRRLIAECKAKLEQEGECV